MSTKKTEEMVSKARIKSGGGLSIFREGKEKNQVCPWGNKGRCGDECPHFGEPVAIRRDPHPEQRQPTQLNPRPQQPSLEEKLKWPVVGYGIEICFGKRLSFDELVDERVK